VAVPVSASQPYQRSAIGGDEIGCVQDFAEFRMLQGLGNSVHPGRANVMHRPALGNPVIDDAESVRNLQCVDANAQDAKTRYVDFP
jgi:hypothetical protein